MARFLGVAPDRIVKSLLVMTEDGEPRLLLLRGDHMLNEIKASKHVPGMRFATEEEVRRFLGASPGSIGPVGARVPVWADRALLAMADFVCGANEDDHHLTGVNFGRDLPDPSQYLDLRNVEAGDPSPDGKGSLELCRGIEVGHIFQLRTKYSEAMGCTYLDEAGLNRPMEMGCYGIGVTRIVATAIEQNNDEKGILWPTSIAPFQIAIAPVGWSRSADVKAAAEQLYEQLTEAGHEVFLDDRDERPGVMFADLELIGIPHRVTIGDRRLKQGIVEYQSRREGKMTPIAIGNVVAFLQDQLG